ncbi:DUF485 domain-containing protein [Alicyclobacillus macrosporangiidus]|uniref:DUF485 domain-containing protein n=1 Tax=Alicyclobacillus macrosporangiidus TaxID=392015 RepID=UPI000496F9EE|nr:DUF485 domain-containing protein [Alicyclobacillus macrosporangiidus]
MAHPDLSDNWQSMAATPAFRRLVASKKRFLVPTIVFFLAYYLLLCVFAGWAKPLMGTRVFGAVNFGYLFALSQFVMVWVICWLYVRRAAEFDALAAEVAKEEKDA